MARVCLFPGSFNPFTKGHADIVERALALFDKAVIGVGYNEQKMNLPADEASTNEAPKDEASKKQIPSVIAERVEAIKALYAAEPRVDVMSYSGLTVEAAKQVGACAILRSVRCVKDYEYELQMADVNRQLTGVETVVLFARPELASISSSVVRELQHFGYDTSSFLPDPPNLAPLE